MTPDLTPDTSRRLDSAAPTRPRRRRGDTPSNGDVLGTLSAWRLRNDSPRPLDEGAWGLDRLLGDVLDGVMALQNAELGTVVLYRPDRAVLELAAERNFRAGFADRATPVRVGEGAVGLSVQTRKRVIVEDVDADECYTEHRAFAAREGYRALQSTPLFSGSGAPLGVIATYFTRPHRPSERELELTDHYARQAASLIERHLFEVELLEAKAAAERASEGKSHFLALVSHELRTPISAILGYTHLLTEGIPEPIGPRATDQVQRISACASYLTEVIDQVLEYSRLEAGEDTVHVTRVPTAEVISEVASVVQPLAHRKGLALRLRTSHAPEAMTTDRRRLCQILLNLLGNAVKFTDSGEVSLTIRRSSGRLLFHVTDQGCGIDPKDIEAMFDPFVQGERTASSGRRGAGLGLAIARMFARGLGGDLSVESEPGRGSTFTLWMPERPRVSDADS